MNRIAQLIFVFFFAIPLAIGFGSQTVKQIDEIKNNTGTDILLNPTDKVDIGYFAGEKALQSTVYGELEESAITNTELGYLTGLLSNAQSQIDSKAPNARLINTTAPLQGGGDLSLDRTLSILQAGAIQDGYLSSTDWNNFDGKQEAITGVDGDLYYYNSGLSNLAIGTTSQILSVSALGFPEWIDLPPAVSVTTKGDIQTYSTSPDRLSVGTDGQVLVADSAETTGLKWVDFSSTPTTTEGDLILRGAIEDERLPIGTSGQLLTSNGTTASWQDAPISLPSQTGEGGNFLTTNGTVASWENINNRTQFVKDNLLTCPTFQACALDGVVTSGAGIDFSATTTRTNEAPAFNGTKLNLTQSAAGTLDYTVTKATNFDGKQMVAYCEIKTANTGVTFNSMKDGVVQSTLSVSSNNSWKYYEIPFVGGATSQGFKIDHVTSAEIPDIDVANCYLGKANPNIIKEIGSAHFVGKLDLSNNCVYQTTSATFAKMLDSAPCNATNVIGNVTQNTNPLEAGIKIPNFRTDGYYRVETNGLHYTSGAGVCYFSLSKSTNLEGNGDLYVYGDRNTNSSLSADIKFESGDTGEVYIIGKSTGVPTCTFYGNSGNTSAISVHFYPDDKSTMVTQDTELTAKTVNTIKLRVNNNGTASIASYNYDNAITSVTRTSLGHVTIDYTALELKELPTLQLKAITADDKVTPTVVAVSLTSADLVFRNYAGIYADMDFSIDINKQLSDVNKSATIVGKFENINSSKLCYVEANNNDGEAITSSTEDIPFKTIVKDDCGAWSNAGNTGSNTNDAFTANKNGVLFFSGVARQSTGTQFSIEVYDNNSYVATCGQQLDTTISSILFSCIVPEIKDHVYTLRFNDHKTVTSSPTHVIRIMEFPDYESVIANLSNQKTKCQTKHLSTNVTTNGNIPDLAFSNLSIGKMYSINVFLRSANTAFDNIVLQVDHSGQVLLAPTTHANATGTAQASGTSYIFKALASTITSQAVSLTSGTIEGDGSNNLTWIQLCELPDTYVETTEF